MNILFLGNFDSPFCSEVFYKRTLEEMGHVVIPFQEGRATGDQIVSKIYECTIVGSEIVSEFKADAFFWVHTHGWKTLNIEGALSECRKHGVVTFGYHLDLYMGLQRWNQYKDVGYLHLLDHFFTVDKLMAEWINEQRGKTVGHFLPAGVYEGECVLGTPNKEKYPHEIIFTGSKQYHHEWPYRPQLIDWLHETYGNRFGHYGGGGLPTVRGLELNNLYASAKIVIGDTLCKKFTYPYYSSDRLFEVTGRGGFLIYPYIKGLEDWFQEDEIGTYDFNDFKMLEQQIEFYLRHEPIREEMRLAGFRRTKAEHTYRHRLTELLIKLELTKE